MKVACFLILKDSLNTLDNLQKEYISRPKELTERMEAAYIELKDNFAQKSLYKVTPLNSIRFVWTK